MNWVSGLCIAVNIYSPNSHMRRYNKGVYCFSLSEPMPLLTAPATLTEPRRNDLARLQLEVARRADQLARLVIPDRATDVALWLQAEDEIFARHQRPTERASR